MYTIFMIDPPWPKKKGGLRKVTPNQTRELDYSTMSVGAIFRLLDASILPLAETRHTVFLWTVEQFLWDAENEMKKRDYHLHIRLIWDKGNGVAPAFTVRYTHEYLLWFYKPHMTPITIGMRGKLGSVIREGNREHSRKPDAAYKYVASLFPTEPKIDVFSREPREGWAQWGNECDKFAGV